MKAFDLLDDKIKKYVWDKKWSSFRPIQETAIRYILQTDDNYILAAKTASGKTEAAFLPAISSIDDWNNGVKILYISPLIALINDQFLRIEQLCGYLDIDVTKWHGEASKSKKEKLIKNPQGILLITPESIEAIFVNHPEYAKSLFPNLRYVVIDEIHSFLGTLRGKHLQSLLHRVQLYGQSPFRLIGLSATLSNESYELVKHFVSNDKDTKVIVDSGKNKISVSVIHYPTETSLLPNDLIDDLYENTQTKKSLVFPNTRGRVEEIAVRLKKLSKSRHGIHSNYFSHHSSVDRELREFVEEFAKTSYTKNFAISCTSTLELGIDIGSIDTVIQVDSTFSISSLIQRLGRSGRTTGQSNLIMYTTNEWSLLQSIACIELYKKEYIEPVDDIEKPFDAMLQQILSIVKERSGISISYLENEISKNICFAKISNKDLNIILNHLIEQDILERLDHELIIGIEGEKIVNSRDFYSLFDSEDNFKVESGGNKIGELPLSPQLIPGENIFLAAKIWKIVDINTKSKKIFVKPATDGKKPKFFGSAGVIHNEIRKKMCSILRSEEKYSYLNPSANTALETLRKKFELIKTKTQSYLPIFNQGKEYAWYTFSGTKINRTIDLLFKINGYEDILFSDSETSFIAEINLNEAISNLKNINIEIGEIRDFLKNELLNPDNIISFGKFGKYLPIDIQVRSLIKNFYEIEATSNFLNNLIIDEPIQN